MPVNLGVGWHLADLRVRDVSGVCTRVSAWAASWPQMPRTLSFELEFSGGPADSVRVAFDAYRLSLSSMFLWPALGETTAVIVRVKNDRIGGQPASALAEMRHAAGNIGRIISGNSEGLSDV